MAEGRASLGQAEAVTKVDAPPANLPLPLLVPSADVVIYVRVQTIAPFRQFLHPTYMLCAWPYVRV